MKRSVEVGETGSPGRAFEKESIDIAHVKVLQPQKTNENSSILIDSMKLSPNDMPENEKILSGGKEQQRQIRDKNAQSNSMFDWKNNVE